MFSRQFPAECPAFSAENSELWQDMQAMTSGCTFSNAPSTKTGSTKMSCSLFSEDRIRDRSD
jgi:hypothetical protein